MKTIRTILASLLLALASAASLAAQNTGPDIPLTGSIGIKGGRAILGASSIVLNSDADYTLGANEYATKYLKVTSTVTLSATRNLIAPLNFGQEFVVENATTGGQTICVLGTSGSSACVPSGFVMYLGSNGTGYNIISRTYAAADIAGLIQGRTNCNTGAGYFWQPQTNTCAQATNLAGGTTNSIHYQSAPGVTAFLPANMSSTTAFLAQTAGGVPVWIAGLLPNCGGYTCASQYNFTTTSTTPTIAVAFTNTSTSIVLNNSSLLSAQGCLVVAQAGQEALCWDSNDTATNTLSGLHRGVYATSAASGSVGTTVTQILRSDALTINSAPTYVLMQNGRECYALTTGGSCGGAFSSNVVFIGPTQFNGLMTSLAGTGTGIAWNAILQNGVTTGNAAAGVGFQLISQTGTLGKFSINNPNATKALNGGPGAYCIRLLNEGDSVVPGYCLDQSYSEHINGAFSSTPSLTTFNATSTTINTSSSNTTLTLTGNVAASTVSTASSLWDGQRLCVSVVQDATGGRTFPWPTAMTGPPIALAANARTTACFNWNATTSTWFLEGTREREEDGQVTLSGGTATYTLVRNYSSTPACYANDVSALAAATANATSTTSVTVLGSGSDTINVHCRGR